MGSPWTGSLKGSMDLVHRGDPWTWGPCFVYILSVQPKCIKLWTDGQISQCYLSCNGVNLSIGSNLKFAPVPCTILEHLIADEFAPR